MRTDTHVIEWTRSPHDIFELQPLTRDVYYWFPDGDTKPWIAHVCQRPTGRLGNDSDVRWTWTWGATTKHALHAAEPLHLEPSIGWQECCGRHGFIRRGLWEPAEPPGAGFIPSCPLWQGEGA